ncbi:MAG: MFS transporter, partial [candidate division NC10 bacterium]
MPILPFPLLPIAFLTGIFYLNFVSRIILGPFLPVIERELDLGHGGAGSLFLFIQLGYASGLLSSGLVSWRFTHRRTITASTIAVGISMIGLSRCASLWEIRLGLVFLGAAAGLYLPTAIATITHLVNEAHWGKALAVHELAPSLGYITAPLLAEALFAAVSWRGVLAVVGVGAILLGGCFALWGKGRDVPGEAPRIRTMARVLRDPSVLVMAFLFAVAIGAAMGAYTMYPLFLVSEIGLSLPAANAITGLSRVSSLAVVLCAGWLTDRVGERRALVLALTTTGVLTLGLGLFPGPTVTPVFIFLQSAAVVLFFPPAFTAIARLVPAHLRNLAI